MPRPRKQRTLADKNRDFHALFETSETGRRVLLDILKDSKVLGPVPVGDPYMLHFYEGMRHVGHSILAFLKKTPEQILTMMEEGNGL